MKRLTFLLLLIISNLMFSQNLKEYRTLIQNGKSSEEAAKSLIEKSAVTYNSTKEPIYAGFGAVGNFFMAKHAFNPLKKISYFNNGKKMLEGAVKDDPANLELRLMRLIAQENIQRILGYHQHTAEDRTFIIKEYKKVEDAALKKFIIEYLKL